LIESRESHYKLHAKSLLDFPASACQQTTDAASDDKVASEQYENEITQLKRELQNYQAAISTKDEEANILREQIGRSVELAL
jgi:superoxide dismutase